MTVSSRNKSNAKGSTDFTFSNSALYADKSELTGKNLAFTINSIELQEGRGWEGGSRWAITISMSDRPDEIVTLGCNELRDVELRTAKAHLEKHGPICSVRLKKSGNAYFLQSVAKAPSK